MQKIHYILGYSGLIPFIGLTLLVISGRNEAYYLLTTYAALIVSFLGGVVWMTTINSMKHWSIALFSNVIMLIAWAVLIFPGLEWQVSIMALSLLSLLMIEYRFLSADYQDQFVKLRRNLSLIAASSLILADLSKLMS